LKHNFGSCSFEAEPEHTLFVGDMDTDKQAAKAAGCDFMWADQYFEGDQGVTEA
jgi:phosphoglycolate phosphatase-like HAD superfamily hydrolase